MYKKYMGVSCDPWDIMLEDMWVSPNCGRKARSSKTVRPLILVGENGSLSTWTWLSNVLMQNISAICHAVSDTYQVSWFLIKFSSIQIGHRLANSSLEMRASSLSEMTHIQFPLPACTADYWGSQAQQSKFVINLHSACSCICFT